MTARDNLMGHGVCMVAVFVVEQIIAVVQVSAITFGCVMVQEIAILPDPNTLIIHVLEILLVLVRPVCHVFFNILIVLVVQVAQAGVEVVIMKLTFVDQPGIIDTMLLIITHVIVVLIVLRDPEHVPCPHRLRRQILVRG